MRDQRQGVQRETKYVISIVIIIAIIIIGILNRYFFDSSLIVEYT